MPDRVRKASAPRQNASHEEVPPGTAGGSLGLLQKALGLGNIPRVDQTPNGREGGILPLVGAGRTIPALGGRVPFGFTHGTNRVVRAVDLLHLLRRKVGKTGAKKK